MQLSENLNFSFFSIVSFLIFFLLFSCVFVCFVFATHQIGIVKNIKMEIKIKNYSSKLKFCCARGPPKLMNFESIS